jgi:hypothetical protein
MPQLAFDRSVRSVDVDGRLHVKLSNISKANVCPYYGYEIPGAEDRGLDPNKIYMLLRDPEELARAAPSFNNIPLLDRHVAVSADAPQKEFIVGSTGTDARFDGTYLQNSLVVWDQIAIDGIQTKEQCEISCGYRYSVDWTPGVYENTPYDGRMTNIIGNHVALVEVGRAGPDVVVGDKNPFTTTEYKTMKLSRKAVAIRAALGTILRPQLAQDAAALDLGALVKDVKSATIAQDSARIVAAVVAKFPTVDQTALADAIKFAADAEPDDALTAEDQQPGESDEDFAKRKAGKQAKDALPQPSVAPTAAPKQLVVDVAHGMDEAAITALVAKERAAAVADMNALRQAEREVLPLIGEVIGQDSAAAVYKMALDQAGTDLTGVHVSAYPAMVKMLLANKQQAASQPAIAQDSAASASIAAMFPAAGQLKRS